MAYLRRQQHQKGASSAEQMTAQIGRSSASQRISRWVAIVALAAFTVSWYCTPLASVVSGMVVSVFVPRHMDIIIGKTGVRSSSYRPSSNFEQQRRVKNIGNALLGSVDASLTRDFDFSFEVIDEPVVNAFAYPGGPIFITSQLLDRLAASDDEIAAVLAHEIGHVISRHSIKNILSNSFINILWAAALYDDKDDHEESFGEAIGEVLLKYAVYLGTLAFSRSNEYEADNRGWEILQFSRFNPHGMISFFSKLQAMESSMRSKGGADRAFSKAMWWYQTHPYTEERIRALKAKT